ncbi:LTA synthase family protein [Acetobacteraceae bacterium ESL0709]|nr:LTA synthase family protein [Acetobacteraceae bacterium ESL0697]MDF7677126.1 LTA synthase family protein [Acetobacteraceae bacterium ESL0709]
MPLRILPILLLNSLFLLLSGSLLFSLFMGALLMTILVTGSNLKLRLLNEPLVFTDLALVSAFIKHPAFYLQAVPLITRIMAIIGSAGLILILIYTSSRSVTIRLEGGVVALLSGALLWIILERKSRPDSPAPALWADVRDKGLLPTLMLYTCRWERESPLPAQSPLSFVQGAPEAVLIIQCESFADPTCLNPEWQALPELEKSRKEAFLWGELNPSGLGAYTMRSEYGVLCGESDQVLSYRQFDPFLAATHRSSHALPRRLEYFYRDALFLHPYDLRFYGRDRLMPSMGFTEIVGGKQFKQSDHYGPYVSDRALTDFLLDYLDHHKNFLAYCVTIENHGPWKNGRLGQKTGSESWYTHVRHSDAMLGTLREAIKASGRDIMLVFFGDHRPALAAVPPVEGLERTTPYVILRPNSEDCSGITKLPVKLTPAELHETILGIISSGVGYFSIKKDNKQAGVKTGD